MPGKPFASHRPQPYKKQRFDSRAVVAVEERKGRDNNRPTVDKAKYHRGARIK